MEIVTEPEARGTDRRRFLAGAGLSAAVLAASLGLPGRALAQATGGDEATAEEPEEADFLAFAESVELAVADAQAAIAGRLGGPVASTLNTFAAHHRAHAAELAQRAGAAAKGAANPGMAAILADQIEEALTNTELLEVARELENTMAATHLGLTRLVESAPALRLVATILPVESEHAVVIGLAAGLSGTDLFPDGGEADPENSFETQRKALDLTVFPIEPQPEEEAP